MTPEIYSALAMRSLRNCECSCGAPIPPGELDHFFGRAKSEESLETCWFLAPRCHFEKTRNHPSSSIWLERFIRHCERHGYAAAAHRARMRLEWCRVRSSFPAVRA